MIDNRLAAGSILGMGTDLLRHLAVIATPQAAFGDEPGPAVLASCNHAARIARLAFDRVPALEAFSWLCPDLDRLLERSLAQAAAEACAGGALALQAVAAQVGAAFRVCGRIDDLPAAALGKPAPLASSRTLLWYQRYSGRNEIVRAAERFFLAHPGRELSDGELDRWMDTADLPDPDLMVFAGGALEPRDVLIWQGSYAEIWHTPSASFEAEQLGKALADYNERQRRFGR